MAKRRVFISFHHKGDQKVVDEFSKIFSDYYEIFTDKSLERAADSENTEYLNQVCRDAIDDTSVTIVMISEQTGCRKYVDWEIRHTLYKEHGLVAISRPDLDDSDGCLPKRLKDNLKSGTAYSKWYKYPNSASSLKSMIDEAYNADVNRIDNSRDKAQRNSAC